MIACVELTTCVPGQCYAGPLGCGRNSSGKLRTASLIHNETAGSEKFFGTLAAPFLKLLPPHSVEIQCRKAQIA
jgi:hypothetical protein